MGRLLLTILLVAALCLALTSLSCKLVPGACGKRPAKGPVFEAGIEVAPTNEVSPSRVLATHLGAAASSPWDQALGPQLPRGPAARPNCLVPRRAEPVYGPMPPQPVGEFLEENTGPPSYSPDDPARGDCNSQFECLPPTSLTPW